ncbi:tetratricopeptide repeat protein [Dactylosporangium sp. NBC_01737]|uniref:AfsR/SARP family transcriptional regulator n=1 Tax=Dactylosporangium sp. NBC_01737 TaxID=2975959 RepID=UPI002E10F400|nr:tetratricopeptide repeat protein [Dactylosporangium sp. NBC_01737]
MLTVQFRLLGTLEADIAGRPVELGHARQQSVLAVLLADVNTVVPVGQLLERIWGDRPPQRARETLYSYLSRLRRALSVTGEAGLHRRSGGYVLAVDPSAVDVVRFHRLAMTARTADDDDALALFDEALALWRGEAFAGLDTPWLGALRDQLGQHRFAVELDRNDVALRRGRHAEVLPGLSAHARAYPLDERLAGQLMLALYRSGRQADALAHYEQARRVLVEELGADPGPALRELHQRILTEEAVLPAPATAAPEPEAAAPPVPRQLPAPPRLFVGRSRALARLTEVLGQRPGTEHTVPIATIAGTGGIGKTWLALRWAHDNLHRFPDGQLYLNLHGFSQSGRRQSPATAIRSLLEALAPAPSAIPSDLSAQTALYRSLVAGKRMLIVLDNAYDADHVRPLLPGSAGCAVVVTSRNQLPGLVATEGAQPLVLQVLTAAEASDLLARRLRSQPVAADRPSVDRIVAACAGLPLALSIVAARAATNPAVPLAALADDLADNRGNLDGFAGGDPSADLRAVFSWSYRALDADAARVFRLLGLHPGPTVTAPAVASLAGLAGGRARSLLEDLVRANVATMLTPGRYGLHDLLRTYATELVQSDDDRRDALHRVLDHYLHTAYAAALLIEPHRDPISLAPAQPGVTAEPFAGQAEALEWFVAEQSVLLAAVDQAAEAGYDGHAWRLAWAAATFLSRGARWQDLTATQRVALAAAERAQDLVGQAHAHRDLALACNHTGRPEDATAHLQRAFDLFGALGDQVGQAYTCLFLGWVSEWQGQQRGALRHDERALALFQAAGHKVGQAKALNAVGWDHAQAGDHEQAISYCQRALTLHEALDNRTGAAKTWDSLGYAHQQLGHHDRAIDCFRHALALYRRTGEQYGEAETLEHLGDSHHATGDLAAARDAWQRALDRLGEQSPSETDQLRAKLRRLDGS